MFAATALLVLPMLLLTGCTIEKEGVVHHVIIGFGVVSVNKTNVAAQVVKTQAVGIYGSDAPGTKFMAGYLAQTVTIVHTNSNVILEIK